MAVCANCKHDVLVHALSGCRARKRDETCPCLFDYDADTKSFNSKALPVNPCLLGHVDGCEHVKDPTVRQCRAEWHGRGEVVRCVLEVTENTRHVCDHTDGKNFHWTEGIAVYPTATDQFVRGLRMAGDQVNEHLRATATDEKRFGAREGYSILQGAAAGEQVGGDHYRQTSIQPWDIVDDWSLDYYRGNALKYLLRAGRKGPALQDLEKARHYIEKCIEREKASGKE
jgi:hypothetical protein